MKDKKILAGVYPALLFESKSSAGFTLIEVLVYCVIFAVSAIFLTSVLTVATKSQLRQVSQNEVNQQLSFVSATIQRLVKESSVIENEAGISSSTLVLRMASSSRDKSFIYASGTALYLEEGSQAPKTGIALPLTNDKVALKDFLITKYEVPGGLAVVQTDVTLDYQSPNPQARFSKAVHSAIGRVSAATFDSPILPNANNLFDLGSPALQWSNAFFSGNVNIGGITRFGSTITTGFKAISLGNLGFVTSTVGVVLMAPNGTNCYRLGVSNSGALSTTSVACP